MQRSVLGRWLGDCHGVSCGTRGDTKEGDVANGVGGRGANGAGGRGSAHRQSGTACPSGPGCAGPKGTSRIVPALVGAPVTCAADAKIEEEPTTHAKVEEELIFLRNEVARLRSVNSQLEREREVELDSRQVCVHLTDAASPDERHNEPSGPLEIGRLGCCGDGDTVAIRQIVGVVLIILCFAAFSLAEHKKEMSWKEHRTMGVLCATIVLWLTELLPIPITGLLVGVLLFLADVVTLSEALSAYMGNLTIILFGSHFIALAMQRHGLNRRLAIYAMSLPCVKGVAWRERLAMMLCGWMLSMWVSNTGATQILVPITLSSVGAERNQMLSDSSAQRTLTGSLLSVAYGCNSGGMGTLVGTPPNIVAMTFLELEGLEVSFGSWMLIGIPASALVCCTAFLVLFAVYKPSNLSKCSETDSERRATERTPLGPLTWGEKVVLGSFFLTLFFWLFPSFYDLAEGPDHKKVKAMLPAGVVVILGTLPLHVVPDTDCKTRILPWSDAKHADWGIIMLVGGGVLLGKTMLSTGLAERCAEAFIAATGVNSIWTLTLLVVFITIFATEVTSNTATTNMMVPIVIAVSRSIDPYPSSAAPAVIGVAFAASCAFMMPIATPPNYIITETGHVSVASMIKPGFLVNMISVVILWIVLRVLAPLLWPPS